ncbi:multiheme c-type cytochrome [Rubripirellula lacrimiformis]|nr:multiheme c-type cytochrome [Rubripirellula lacrimiformis]
MIDARLPQIGGLFALMIAVASGCSRPEPPIAPADAAKAPSTSAAPTEKPPARPTDGSGFPASQAAPPESTSPRNREMVDPEIGDREIGERKIGDLGNSASESAADFPGGFVGTAACAKCHADRYASYQKTHHSRSLRRPTAADLPTGLAFHHPASHRTYTVRKSGSTWVHEDERYFGDSPDTDDRMPIAQLPIAQLPVEYVMGSGAFAKGYLVRDGDYLLQSPITWYTSPQAYAIAPGYDTANQAGFGRVIEDSCVYCHAGIVSTADENPNRLILHELSIGCERCHGAGADHTALYRDRMNPDLQQLQQDEIIADTKIVNPSSLDRHAAESICAQCHLDADVTVMASGETVWDYQPGEDLIQNRLAYKSTAERESVKTFSNHFDQMWQSQCYLQSDTMTCVTCHDPHDPHASDLASDKIDAFRNVCQSCHVDQGCAVPLPQRETENQNACAACHMPRAGSDIPHASITNHLIAVYQDGKPRGVTRPTSPPMRRVSQSVDLLSPEELHRRDVMAEASWSVLQAINGQVDPILASDDAAIRALPSADEIDSLALLAETSRQRAKAMILQKSDDGATDDEAADDDTVQKQIQQSYDLAHYFAVKTLRQETKPTKTRQLALETLADKMIFDQSYDQAIPLYEELTRIRRDARDWYNLAICYANQRRISDAEEALQRSLDLDAAYAKPYASLAKIYSYVDAETAARFQRIAERLSQNAPNGP